MEGSEVEVLEEGEGEVSEGEEVVVGVAFWVLGEIAEGGGLFSVGQVILEG